jgi:acyl dehydratase
MLIMLFANVSIRGVEVTSFLAPYLCGDTVTVAVTMTHRAQECAI